TGNIDETDRLDQLLGEIDGPAVFICNDVQRINSVGVKSWIKFFGALFEKKKNITFKGFSPSLVEQLNVVKNFVGPAKVLSVIGPYQCESCGNAMDVEIPVSEIKSKGPDAFEKH